MQEVINGLSNAGEWITMVCEKPNKDGRYEEHIENMLSSIDEAINILQQINRGR